VDPLTLIGISVGLAMDALAVSVANGFAIEKLHCRQAFRIAFAFGLFQSAMPLLGWAAGRSFRHLIQGFDHWIAFVLLAFIGGKMIAETRAADRQTPRAALGLKLSPLLLLSLATSIDALAVGVSFAFLEVRIATAATTIGLVTFALCFIGVHVGHRSGHFFENRLEFVGGVILIAIGAKIFVEHIVRGI
jgi:manganese efflux pump family protein